LKLDKDAPADAKAKLVIDTGPFKAKGETEAKLAK